MGWFGKSKDNDKSSSGYKGSDAQRDTGASRRERSSAWHWGKTDAEKDKDTDFSRGGGGLGVGGLFGSFKGKRD